MVIMFICPLFLSISISENELLSTILCWRMMPKAEDILENTWADTTEERSWWFWICKTISFQRNIFLQFRMICRKFQLGCMSETWALEKKNYCQSKIFLKLLISQGRMRECNCDHFRHPQPDWRNWRPYKILEYIYSKLRRNWI